MRSRQTLLEMFSTFLQFEADHAVGWATDARLRRGMQRCLDQCPEKDTSETFWTTYWHQQWRREQADISAHPTPDAPHLQRQQVALGHLSAHLQEVCYWSAYKAAARLEGSQARLSDCFQVAIAQVPKILNVFDATQQPSLKTYAGIAFGNAIRDDLRQRREVDRCNDWGLLLKLSRKQLIEALQAAGLLPDEIDRLVLAWNCLLEAYGLQKTPGLRKLTAPTRSTWEAIARLYNQRRLDLSHAGAEGNPETLERWLLSSAARARAYLYPPVGSLNVTRPGQDSGELQDDLPDRDRDSLLTELIAQEDLEARQAQYVQLNAVLKTALASLDPPLPELLRLYFQQALTQQQIAAQLNLQQYAVSRKLTKAREALLLALTKWSQETLHISPTSDVVKFISITLDEWLNAHFNPKS